MGAGYQVILGDLGQAATAFATESKTLKSLQPQLSPSPASSGDGGLDAILRALLDTFGTYGTALSGALADHAGKLNTCHNNYKQNDADVVELFNTMLSALGKG